MTTTPARTRLSPEARRTQLLELGARLFATRSVEEISIDVLAEEAGISRGLIYHYFGSKQDFRLAVIRHAVEDLVEQTAPPADGEPLERMLISLGVYVDYVLANLTLYRSLVRAAAGGTDEIRALYDECRFALTERIFREDAAGEIVKVIEQVGPNALEAVEAAGVLDVVREAPECSMTVFITAASFEEHG